MKVRFFLLFRLLASVCWEFSAPKISSFLYAHLRHIDRTPRPEFKVVLAEVGNKVPELLVSEFATFVPPTQNPVNHSVAPRIPVAYIR